ncbi:MAG: helix-turn-helix transcriptional regulator [Pseudomonadota bacterium]
MIWEDAARTLADGIASTRRRQHMSRAELAIKTSIPKEEIEAFESATLPVPVHQLMAFCDVLGVEPVELFLSHRKPPVRV